MASLDTKMLLHNRAQALANAIGQPVRWGKVIVNQRDSETGEPLSIRYEWSPLATPSYKQKRVKRGQFI